MNQNQETELERANPKANLLNTILGANGPGVPRPIPPELTLQVPVPTLLLPMHELERPDSPISSQERINNSSTGLGLRSRAARNENSEPIEEATHRGGRVRKPPAYLKDNLCK